MKSERKFKVAAFGEVLWDLLPDASLLGGAPFNFTYRINSLGNEGLMISAIGKDTLGEKALKTISELHISDRYIQVNPDYPTGTVNVFFDELKNPDYEIIRDVAYDFVSFDENLERLILQVDCICFGTLAQRNPVSAQTLQNLLHLFKGRYRLYDLNLRKDCFSRDIIISSLHQTDILKLNRQEAVKLNDLLRLEKNGLEEICRELIKSFQLQYCVITLEQYGSLAGSDGGEMVYNPGFSVELADPLGAGDAFTAGFVDALLRDRSLKEASESGNQFGALVATQKGATQKIEQDDLSQIALTYNRISDECLRKYLL
jgi:fructokinase